MSPPWNQVTLVLANFVLSFKETVVVWQDVWEMQIEAVVVEVWNSLSYGIGVGRFLVQYIAFKHMSA